MSKNKKMITAALLSGLIVIPSVMPLAFAENYNITNGEVTVNHEPTTSVDGQIPADGTITIQGSSVNQSMKNKKFVFYKIFDVENAAHEESVNYKFVDKYKQAVQNVVAEAVNKKQNKNIQPADVSEYLALDYIRSLSPHLVEGAKTPQKVEGRYSDFRYFTEDLKNEIKKLNITGDEFTVESTNEQNEFKVKGLSWGYYFVDEVSTGDDISNGQPGTTPDGRGTDGVHYASSLVLVNTVNNEATIKLKSDYPEIIKKIQEDDNKDEIGNEGWNDVADYEIGQTIPYNNDIRIPDMNGYHGYYLAIQDRMDQELTFHADKNKIKLTIKKGDKSYIVKNEEYNLSTFGTNVTADFNEMKGQFDGTSTFGIEFEDFKALVDREFNNMNPDNENDYTDLTMHVEYEATLNELAVEKTGRPGFENDVRLVFSNDPDSTGTGFNKPNIPPKDQPKGKTPWDTVVAFTYKLNGLKTNKNDFKLEDAQFKIYSDEEMQNEVYVKQVNGHQPKEGTNTSDPGMKTEPKSEPLGDVGTVGTTENLKDTVDNATRGDNKYVVINRDKLGGTDHTGGEAPADAVTIKSDKDGNFTIIGLDSGTYYLKEVKPPVGYRLLEKPVKLVVKGKMTDERNSYIKGDGATDKTLKSIEATGDIDEFYNGIFKHQQTNLVTNADEGSIDAKVVNEVLTKLPITGSQMMVLGMTAGAGLIAFGIYGVSRKRKRQ